MSANDPRLATLSDLVTGGQLVDSEALARELGSAAEPALTGLLSNPSADVRRNAIEIAAQAGAGGCRVILRALEDPYPDNSNLAVALLTVCNQPEVAADLLAAAQRFAATGTRGPLVRQVGIAGTATQVSALRQLLDGETDVGLVHDIELALARLGDAGARDLLARHLRDGDLGVRFQALQDSIYVNDLALVAHFGLAIDDERDVMAISNPEETPLQYARICDVAVMAMARLGVHFGFPVEGLTRHTEKELHEARAALRQLSRDSR